MSEQIRIEGLGKLNRELRELELGLDGAVKEINTAAAALIASDAAGRAPKRSGKLAGSIRVSSTKTTAAVRAGGSAAPYAAPIHWGWAKHNISPQPFMYEALDARRGEVIDMYDREIKALVDRTFATMGL